MIRCHEMRLYGKAELGFTLLEVLVALALIGIGFSATFGVVSGVHKLEDRASAQNVAMLFARATLDEFIETGATDDSDAPGDARFGGHEFSYRLTSKPFKIASLNGSVRDEFPAKLDQVDIEVFWGGIGVRQSYRLVTLVSRQMRAVSASKAATPSIPATGLPIATRAQQ